jgi:GNAT superfamily N-acetyltransferase
VSEGPPQYSILDLATVDEETIRQAANLLVEGFRDNWPGAWPTEEEALEEVREALREGRICRAALGEDGTVLGWIGGMPAYEGKVWELHPLVVRPDFQRKGIGRNLVVDLEARVAERGALTLWLGTDDETDMTTLSRRPRAPRKDTKPARAPLRVLPRTGLLHYRRDARRQRMGQARYLHGQALPLRLGRVCKLESPGRVRRLRNGRSSAQLPRTRSRW